MRQKIDHRYYCRADYHHAHAGENEEHQRRHEFDRGLGGSLLGLLSTLNAERIGEIAERLCNRGSETVRLNQHGHKRACALKIGALPKRLPGGIALHTCPLFKVDEQELLAKGTVADLQFPSYANNGLVQAQASLEADGKQVQAIRKAEPQLLSALVYGVRQPEFENKKTDN